MKDILEKIKAKHQNFLALKPKFSNELENNLYQWFKIALTYTSNAIEGNTLSHLETAQIIEKDITIQGKSLTEHLEAINHAQAIDFIKNLALKKRQDLEIADILMIHKFILQRINDNYAGRFRDMQVRIMGSTTPVPNYLIIIKLMEDFIKWLHTTQDPVIKIAADAHLKLVFIHPFIDGNGRTARLFMNLILLQEDYPLVFIKVEDRLKYIKSIQKALNFISNNLSAKEYILNSNSLEINEFQDYYNIIFESIDNSLNDYIKAFQESNLNK